MTPEQRQRVEQLTARLTMTATERAESFADAFHRATGHFMPGCSVPPAVGGVDEVERRHAWEAWTELERHANIDALRACLAALEAAEQERDDWRLSFETVNDALDKAEAKLAALTAAALDAAEKIRELRAELESAIERHAYHLDTARRLAQLAGVVREWQEARKPVGLAAPGVGVAETYQAAVRRMSAADEALAGYRLDGPDDGTEQCETCQQPITGQVVWSWDEVPLCEACAEVETPAAGKRAQTPDEAEMLRALSDALTGGNASTWEQVLHAAEQHRSESGAPVVSEGPTTNVPLVADMLAASLHAQAVKSRGEG